jgi:hypothetical protein
LTEFNERDTEGIGAVLKDITIELGDELESTIELKFGGSVAKNTFINGLSDIDALVLLKQETAKNYSPSDLKKLFLDRLQARFGRDAVREGTLAVTVTIDGHEIQLLPGVRHGDHFKISSGDGKNWSTIRPRIFAERLTASNNAMDGKLVPTIKLAKGIIGALPSQRQISGYHTEVLAVKIFTEYAGPKTPKDMLRYFFEKLPAAVRQPTRDSTGQSIYLDDYLGNESDVKRAIVSDALERVWRRIKNADEIKSGDKWRELLSGN